MATAAAAVGPGAVALQTAAELAGGAAAKQGALTTEIFIYPEMKVAFTAKV